MATTELEKLLAASSSKSKKSFGSCLAILLVGIALIAVVAACFMYYQKTSTTGLMPNLASLDTTLNAGQPVIFGAPALTPSQVNTILCNAHSSACGTGQSLYDTSVQSGINDAFPMAVFKAESLYGTLGAAKANHSIGNLISNKTGKLVYYSTWGASYADFLAIAKSAGQDSVQNVLDTLYIHPINSFPTTSARVEPSVSLVLATMRQLSAGK